MSIIVGTRPQIIKSAPVYHAFVEKGIECDIVNTGQHYDYEMNKVFFKELDLPDPSVDLDVGAGTPNEQVSSIIGGLGTRFSTSRPDLAIVPGDTNSALAAGVACSKSGVPVAHLESGCRSNDSRMAEEVNRRILDHMSQVLLCPTASCVKNVRSEKVLAERVANVGDTMYDSLLRFMPSLEMIDAASKHGLQEGGYAFMTLHRAETVDDRETLESTLAGVESLGVPVAFSVHPRTRERMKTFGITPGANIRLFDPLPYVETLSMASRSSFVITDSGGVQKEAYWLGKPVLITRRTTEWGEIVKAGAAFVVGTTGSGIRSGYRKVRGVRKSSFRATRRIFGSGNASANVVEVAWKFLAAGGKKAVGS
ncbi:MAG: UDP-N-acetylglucosamine 2-epimerase (non-hydrolyzing) [Nitrososphaerota archaeon]|nr:UDP-N-acetylglucosamine 2-epimerase (non-hydrolyzing) [Nitrososphaerota archaeon]MDG7023441.1 UDP-N-acetylglucosamine 2-epimerase (non-hydrolyzing) [Nitrososphaerota archaeon]